MLRDHRLEELVRLVYEAAANPAQWNTFLVMFAEALNSPTALLLIHDLKRGRAGVSASTGFDPEWQLPFDEHYATINPWMEHGAHLFQPGAVLVGEKILDNRELIQTEFYNDFMRPQDWFHSCGAVATRSDAETSYITALRPKSAGIFSAAELAVLEYLMPHIQCAVRVHHRIAGLESDLRTATQALDQFPTGVMVVDSSARALLLNRAAESILQRQDGLILLRDGLRASMRQEMASLRNAIAAVSCGYESAVQRPGTVLTISRPSGRRPLEVLVAPLPSRSSMSNGRPAAMLFITDPEQDAGLNEQTLRDRFGLTPAETRMAAALVQGKSVEEYAREAAIGMNTARTHVKRIFAKTGVTRQSELVRLLLSGAARIGQSTFKESSTGEFKRR